MERTTPRLIDEWPAVPSLWDAIIELDDGEKCAFEIKIGANQIEEAAKKLISIKDTIARNKGKPPKVLAIISGLTAAAYRRSDGVFVIPTTALKN